MRRLFFQSGKMVIISFKTCKKKMEKEKIQDGPVDKSGVTEELRSRMGSSGFVVLQYLSGEKVYDLSSYSF